MSQKCNYRIAELLALIGIVAVGGSLRLFRITDRSIWFDESFSWNLATQFTWVEILGRTSQDVHPPLYYFVLRLWITAFGQSLLSLRGLSVICGTSTIVGLYLFCRDATTTSATQQSRHEASLTGLISASLLSVSAVSIRWSQETRMYALGAAFVLFSSWTLVRALRSEDKPIFWWCAYTALAVAGLYTHNFVVFSIAAQFLCSCGLACLQRNQPKAWYSIGVAYTAVFLLYAPWLPVLLQQTRQVRDDFVTVNFDCWSLTDALSLLAMPRNDFLMERDVAYAFVCIGLIGSLLLACAFMDYGRGILLVMAITPPACALLMSICGITLIVDRYFFFSYPFVIGALGSLVARLRTNRLRWVAIIVLVGDSLAIHYSYQESLNTAQNIGVRGAFECWRTENTSSEPLIVANPCVYFSAKYYCDGAINPPKLLIGETPTQYFHGNTIITQKDTIRVGELQSMKCNRIWVMTTSGFGARNARVPSSWKPLPNTLHRFPDVYYFQKEVFLKAYDREPTGSS